MATKTAQVRLGDISPGHMIRQDGVVKIVDSTSVGTYHGTWSLVVAFTDSTLAAFPYPTTNTTTEVVTGF